MSNNTAWLIFGCSLLFTVIVTVYMICRTYLILDGTWPINPKLPRATVVKE